MGDLSTWYHLSIHLPVNLISFQFRSDRRTQRLLFQQSAAMSLITSGKRSATEQHQQSRPVCYQNRHCVEYWLRMVIRYAVDWVRYIFREAEMAKANGLG